MTPPPIPAPQRALSSQHLETLNLRVLLGLLSMLEVHYLATSETVAERSLIAYRWPHGVRCPTLACGSENVRECRGYKRPNELPVRFVCKACGRRFTVRDGYFLARSPLSFRTWLWALYLMTATPELEPECQASLIRQLGAAEDSARSMIRRIKDHIRDTR